MSEDEYTQVLNAAEGLVPVENSPEWRRIYALVPGREIPQWGQVVWEFGDNRAAGTIGLYKQRGTVCAWMRGGPVWEHEPTPEQWKAFSIKLHDYVKEHAPLATFVRFYAPTHIGEDVSVPVTYDHTVVADLTGSMDEVISRMNKHGRRNVRKVLRGTPGTVADETDISREDFQPLADIMAETGARGGFATHTADYYYSFLDELRQVGIARLLVHRNDDGEPTAWLLGTLAYGQATYYFAASTHEGQRAYAPDALTVKLIEVAREAGCTRLDMMGVGSDIAPELASLTRFKSKFANDLTYVNPYREMTINPLTNGVVKAYHGLRKLPGKLKQLRPQKSEEDSKSE